MASSSGPISPTSLEIFKPGVEELNPSKLLLLSNHQEGMLYPTILGSLELLSFKRERSLSLQKDKVCLLHQESQLLKLRGTGTDTTDVLLKQPMATSVNCCHDGIFTIWEPDRMLKTSMAPILTESTGSLATRLMSIPRLTLSIGTQVAMRLFRLGFRLARYSLRVTILKAQEGLLLIPDLLRAHPAEPLVQDRVVEPILAIEPLPLV
ncbi:N2 protein [Human coronavirus OC43]|uniref:Protein I n=2 Tax=Human coronavirus OC43 TaxID=31631 RepID=A0A1L7H9A9_CVHOC|nr:I [Human coronavirus OC43] [Human coronavirus OC43]APU51932.1 I [Human coronavirus OC43] [Human coronavirus OC43]APU51937.1 I [Human coronavirus OC43] [Human coronavirus OC43]ARA15426.1 I protein [Human coronavirus OC43]ARK08656.1 I protein [Human coronavirus OC43]